MNEGVGSTSTIVIIIVFIAIVSAYMAYNVNYTKAFRMKNKIISLYEEYDGECPGSPDQAGTCQNKILTYSRQIGYSSASLNCDTNPLRPDQDVLETRRYAVGYCAYKIQMRNARQSDATVVDEGKDMYYYRILTRIDINVPIVQNVLQLRILNITGDTKLFEKK